MNTKIIATAGLKSDSYEVLKKMIEAGANVIRLNFSHATYEQYGRVKESIDKINEELGLNVKMLFDLQGPRIRIGKLENEIFLEKGDIYSLVYGDFDVSKKELPIDDKDLIKDLKEGDPVFLDNGSIELSVLEIDLDHNLFKVRVERAGLLLSKKGINVPKTVLNRPILTKKDLENIEFAKKVKPDYLAISFVQNHNDIIELRRIVDNDDIKIVSKIERAIALENIDSIIRESDVIMIARGDLGIEIPLEDVPIVQKNLVRHSHWHNKPAIVATQMLASMVNHYRPTRAEVSDVANAIFDGADALMLSDETANGSYPVDSVRTMAKIIKKTNDYFTNRNYFDKSDIVYKK